MKKYKFAKGLFAAVLLATSMISCSEDVMDGINVDRNHATDVQAKFIVTDLITSTAFSSVGGDISLYTSIYMEHEAGVHNQMFNAETRNGEPYLASTFNNVWGSTYTNLKNALTVIKKCSEDGTEPKNFVTLGVGQIMAAYNLAILTDAFGDVPWTEACNLNEFMQPKLDKQELIYGDIIKLLDSAIANLAKSDATPMGSNDILYGGNAAKWKKAAYGLKARYTMRTLAKAADKNAALNNVLDYVSKSFASAAEEMKFNYYDGSSNFNPYFAFGWSRDALAASESLAKLFQSRKDPRGKEAFMTAGWEQVTDLSKLYAAPNGSPKQLQYEYDTSVMYGSETAPTMMLSYHELLFLKAEALVRLSRKADAEPVLKEAMAAAFVNFRNSMEAAFASPKLAAYGGISGKSVIDATVAETYFNAEVKAMFDANPLKEVMVQKYLAFYGASGESFEAYNDYRRCKGLGETFVELKNPLNSNQFPLRLPYGSDDVLANQNVKSAFGDGQYVYTEKVWWAGGSR